MLRPGEAEHMNIRTTNYKGYGIDYNIYGQGEYTVQYCGDDYWFTSEEKAREFIDDIQD